MTGSARFFFFALGGGLFMRLSLIVFAAIDPTILMHSDQLDYIRLANLINLHGLGTAFGAGRVPGYPLFLAFCSWFAPGGVPVADTFGVPALLLSVIVQNCLGFVAIFFIYRLGGLINQTTANLAGGFAALNLNMVVYSSQILTDALFYPLFAGFLYLFFLYRDSGRNLHLTLLAVLLGVATLVRPVTLYLPLLLLPYLLFSSAKGEVSPVERGKRLVLFVSVFAVLLSPWLVRNYVLYGHVGISTQGQGHIVGWVIPGIGQYEEGVDLSTSTSVAGMRWQEHISSLPENDRADPFSLDKEAKRWFGEYLRTVSPVSVAKAWFWGAAKNIFSPLTIELAYIFHMDWTHFYNMPGTSFPEQAVNFLFHNQNRLYISLLVFGIGLTLLFRIAQLFGAWRLLKINSSFLMIIALVITYFLAVSGPVGYAKYRLPLEPLLVLLTAVAAGAFPLLRREAEQGCPPKKLLHRAQTASCSDDEGVEMESPLAE